MGNDGENDVFTETELLDFLVDRLVGMFTKDQAAHIAAAIVVAKGVQMKSDEN